MNTHDNGFLTDAYDYLEIRKESNSGNGVRGRYRLDGIHSVHGESSEMAYPLFS